MQFSHANQKNIPIGIICPIELSGKMGEQLRGFPSFLPILRPYKHEDEIVSLASSLLDEVEVILFSCPYSYRIAYEKIRFAIPAHFVPLTGSGIYRSLFHVQTKHRLQSLTVDTISEIAVRHTFRELGVAEPEIFYYRAAPHPSAEELIHFHHQHFQQHHSISITGVKSVADKLSELGVPYEWVIPTDQDIIVSLERSLLSTQSRKMKESQIVVGFILLDHFAKLEAQKKSEHDLQRLKLDIHRILLDYAESMEGYLTRLDGNQFLFITTRGVFERATGGYKSIPLAKEIKARYGLTMSVGIGFGKSASEAGNHARSALRHAASAGGNHCFIVREDQGLIGPLEMGDPLEYNLSLINPMMLQKAEQAGLHSVYLSKLAARISKIGKIDYVAHDMAFIFGISTRSVHRMLLKLVDSGLAEIVGIDTSNTRGRPKQIYRLKFLEHILRRK
jgi:hypothetical protein